MVVYLFVIIIVIIIFIIRSSSSSSSKDSPLFFANISSPDQTSRSQATDLFYTDWQCSYSGMV